MAIIIYSESKASCCDRCKFYHSGRSICVINAKFIIDEYEEQQKCPVVEFSAPNGRLIDADRLIGVLKSITSISQSDYDLFNRVIEHQPTISIGKE